MPAPHSPSISSPFGLIPFPYPPLYCPETSGCLMLVLKCPYREERDSPHPLLITPLRKSPHVLRTPQTMKMWCRHPCLLLSAARCRRSLLFSDESPCSTNTTSDENGVGWIFDLLCLASRARRTALLSESGETPLLRSAPAPFLFFSYHFSLVPCPYFQRRPLKIKKGQHLCESSSGGARSSTHQRLDGSTAHPCCVLLK